MLNELKLDDLLEKVDSRYGLALAGARRARQINEYTATLGLNDSLGIPGPQVHTRSQHPLSIAFEELRQDKLAVGFRQPPEEADEEGISAAPDAGDDFLDNGGTGTTSGSAEVVEEEVSEEVADVPAEEDVEEISAEPIEEDLDELVEADADDPDGVA